jgi:hypothetical protein
MKAAAGRSSGSGKSTGRLCANAAAAASTRPRTSGSACSSQAIPTASSSGSAVAGSNPPASGSISPVQRPTVRAIGPAWSKLGASGKHPSSGTTPKLGLNPTMPQQAAGIRIEPPESVPSAASASPTASAAAEPPLEPPAIRPGASGFGTVPKCGLIEVTPNANSCRFVFPTFAYPAASTLRTASAVVSGTCSAKTAEP